jgi:phosphohistidine phosphatase
MNLLIVRHATAEDRLAFATSESNDDLRPLTEQGRQRMHGAAAGLRRLLPAIDVLATSPLTRAVQTAKVLAASFDEPPIIEVPSLAPGVGAAEVSRWLRAQPADGTVAVVGHEPDLSSLIAWLTTGASSNGYVKLRKGGACLLACNVPADACKFEMQWLLTPKQLRILGGGG